MDMYKIIPVVLCLFLVSGMAAAQQQPQVQGQAQQSTQDDAILLGTFDYGLLSMQYTPNVTTIETTEELLTFRIGLNAGLSLSSFLNTVHATLITPTNQTYPIENLSRFAVNFPVDGNYTIVLEWGSWIPVVGGLAEAITGSGTYRITIVKSPEPVNYTLYIIIGAAVVGAIILFLSIHRRRTRVLLQ